MPDRGLEDFKRMVLGDDSLQARLRDITGRGEFIATVIELGEAHGFKFTAEDVEEAMRRSLSSRIER